MKCDDGKTTFTAQAPDKATGRVRERDSSRKSRGRSGPFDGPINSTMRIALGWVEPTKETK